MTQAVPIPSWLRRAVIDRKNLDNQEFDDVALSAGAAIGALDQAARAQERWAGVWRQRLALAAAAASAKQAGRIEDEAALRDAVLLTRPGDDVGPAGRLLLAWRRLAERPAAQLPTAQDLAAVLEAFGHHGDDVTVGELAEVLRALATSQGPLSALAGALAMAERHGFGHPFGAWLADTLLAHRLGWRRALPLLGTEPSLVGKTLLARRSPIGARGREIMSEPERVKHLLAAQARAALSAIDLCADLERRAQKLLAVAPKLRAKEANLVVEKLLSDDAMIASGKVGGMSGRSLRRLFDRLVELGVVRELSGRPTFRIYGL